MPSDDQSLAVGDLVALRSGSPVMTIVEDLDTTDSADLFRVSFYSTLNRDFTTHDFPREALVWIPPEGLAGYTREQEGEGIYFFPEMCAPKDADKMPADGK